MKLEIRSNADLHYMFDEDEYFEKNKETRWVSVESLIEFIDKNKGQSLATALFKLKEEVRKK